MTLLITIANCELRFRSVPDDDTLLELDQEIVERSSIAEYLALPKIDTPNYASYKYIVHIFVEA